MFLKIFYENNYVKFKKNKEREKAIKENGLYLNIHKNNQAVVKIFLPYVLVI